MRQIFVVDHPQQLMAAIGFMKANEIPTDDAILLVSKHTYWKYIDKNIPEEHFDKVIFLDRPDYSLFFPIQILRLLKAKHQIHQLRITSKDEIYCFSGCQFIENYIVSNYSHSSTTLIAPQLQKRKSIQEKTGYTSLNKGKIANLLIFPLFGMHKTEHLIKKENQLFGFPLKSQDGGYIQQYKEELTQIYDKVIYLIPINQKTPQKTDDAAIYMKHPFSVFASTKGKRNKVVFLGSPFLLFDNLESEVYIKHINLVLNHIREYFSNFELLYKPHPRESKEAQRIDLSEFKILPKEDNIEVFLYKNAGQIHSVAAVSSSGINSVINFRVNGYLYYPIFPFDKTTRQYYNDISSQLPEESIIADLNKRQEPIFKYD